MYIKKIKRKREVLPPNDLNFRVHRRRQSRVVGKKIVIGESDICDDISHGEFIDCEIRIKSSGLCTGIAILESSFKNCLIWASKKQIIPKFDANFDNCIFKGKFEVRFWGDVIDCDFRMATLYGVSFKKDNKLGNIKWPGYPHVLIKNIEENIEDWNQIIKPKEFNRFLVHPKTNGNTVVLNLADAVKDPDSFWELIKNKSYVIANYQNT